MAARLVWRAILVARPVVKVAHVRIVAHRIVKLYHRVLRLHQPQLVTDPCSQPLIGRLVHASRQSVFAFQHGMVHHRSVVIHTLHPGLHHRHQVSPVTVHVNVSHTQRPHVRALRIDALPFQSRTTVKDEGRHVLAVLHLQSFRRQLWQIFQSQRCQRPRQPQLLQRSALCHRHALHRRASRVQLLQQRLASEVQHRRVLTIAPRVRLSLQVHLSQLAAAARHEPPRRYRCLRTVRHAQVQFPQRCAVVQFQSVQQVACRAPHVQFHNSRSPNSSIGSFSARLPVTLSVPCSPRSSRPVSPSI